MHDNRDILVGRVSRTLTERIVPAQVTPIAVMDVQRYDVPTKEGLDTVPPISCDDAWSQDFCPAEVGDTWGEPWSTTWWRMSAPIPADLRGEHLELEIDLGWEDHSPGFQSEALVYAPNKEIIKALNPRNTWVPVDSTAEVVEVVLEAAANPLLLEVLPFQPTVLGDPATLPRGPLYRLAKASLVQVHDEIRELAEDVDALLSIARLLPEDDEWGWEILLGCSQAIDVLDMADIAAHADEARALLRPLLDRHSRSQGHRISAVGHAHIDSAWLWPIRETKRKVARTMANVCRLLDDGAPMYFALPAAQHVAWLQQDYPDLFERVRHYVSIGRIVPVGGMWVEPDAVLPGGEAMARQLVEGLTYYREQLGATCEEIWLPDSFGYSAALPQIAHLAGIDRFLTQKLSWNQVDVFPHHSLWWEGIDGTRIFTHFPSADTYGSDATAEQLYHAKTSFKDKGRASSSLLPFGYGDGGGGPTREMLHRIERFADIEGMPRIVHETPGDFFARAQDEYRDAPVWVGELYLEKHRGTFTTIHSVKEGNRRSESLLREAELWAATASWILGSLYPAQELRDSWRKTLLAQFHDILPGTSIAWVYKEVEKLHTEVRESCENSIARAINDLTEEDEVSSVMANASSYPLAYQGGYLSPMSLQENIPIPVADVEVVSEGNITTLRNQYLTVRFKGGLVESLIGCAGREVVPPEQYLGQFHLHQDFPNQWDAWDIDIFYRDSQEILSSPQVRRVWSDETGGHVETELFFGASSIRVLWTLQPAAKNLKITVDVDWQEQEKLLKFALPVDVHTDHAQYETQFGHVVRTTHENTSWDAYRFEVSAHRWLRVEDARWGVGIANDSTYGWDITRHPRPEGGTWSQVRATLLRSPRYPIPDTDRGTHRFGFAIAPDADVEDTLALAHHINMPPRQQQGRKLREGVEAPIRVDGAAVESVSYDTNTGDLLVRLYEPLGARSRFSISCPLATRITAVNLSYAEEDPRVYLQKVENRWIGELGPFQIATLRISK